MSWWVIKDWGPVCAWALAVLFFAARLRVGMRARIAVACALAPLYLKLHVFRWLGMDLLSPPLPEAVCWILSAIFAGAMILTVLSVVFFFPFPRRGMVLPAAALGLAAWGVWNGVRVPAVREIELSFPSLPPALDGYRIAQVTDIHASSAARRWRTQAIVDAVNAAAPDLVCITGDIADGPVARMGDAVAPLGGLRARDGVWACAGNHAYFYDFPGWRAFYEGLGIRLLDNACAFPRPGLALGGVPDPYGARHGLDQAPDVRRAFVSATNGAFRVLMQHQPNGARWNLRNAGVSLQMSGHTHGGIAPGIRWVVERHSEGFSRGIYHYGKGVLYVSPGCGQCEWMPTRFFNPSEITLFVLRSGKAGR